MLYNTGMSTERPLHKVLEDIGRGVKGAPKHFRFEVSEPLQTQMEEAERRVWALISGNPSINDQGILRRPVYKRLLGKTIHTGDPDLQMSDQAIPEKPAEDIVHTEITRIATLIADTVLYQEEASVSVPQQNAIFHGVEVLLHTHLRKNLEAIADSNIFYIGKDKWTSTVKMKAVLDETIATLNEGTVQAKEAAVYMLYKLGAISRGEIKKRSQKKPSIKGKSTFNFSDYDHDELEREVEESMTAARTFVNELVDWLQQEIRDQKRKGILNGETARPLPDINLALRNKSPFEMLRFLFREKGHHRDYNDAQMFLIFFLAHWNYQRYLEPIKPRTQNECDRAVMALFETGREPVKGYEPLLSFEGDAFTVVDEKPFTQDLYVAKANEREYPMYLEEMDVKKDNSHIAKTFHKKEGLLKTEDIGDLFRTRLVAWTVTRKDMLGNKTVQQDMHTLCEKTAKTMNVTEQNPAPKTVKDLEKGKYWIEPPEAGNPFTKYTLHARLKNGAPFELQIVPLDLHCYEHTPGSGIDHDTYKAGVYGDTLAMSVPRSTSPLAHEAIDNNRKKRKELRDKTLTAMNSTEMTAFFEDFKSRALAPSPNSPSAEPAAAQG